MKSSRCQHESMAVDESEARSVRPVKDRLVDQTSIGHITPCPISAWLARYRPSRFTIETRLVCACLHVSPSDLASPPVIYDRADKCS